MARSKHSTTAQHILEDRIHMIMNLCLACTPRWEILQIVSKEKWRVSDRTIDSYITKARERIVATKIPEKEEWIKEAKARYEDLYKQSHNVGDYGECRRILDSMGKMFGFEVTNINANIIGITMEDLHREADEWEAEQEKGK
jgi:hypothetical protein